MSGPPPKPAHLRQRTNKKAGAVTLPPAADASVDDATPPIPNPDGRVWHPLTLKHWANAWASPMASQWLESDKDGLGRLAILWDTYNHTGSVEALKEIRLQSAGYGFTPLDRSRLQWEISKADEAESKTARRGEIARKRTGTQDPRRLLSMVK